MTPDEVKILLEQILRHKGKTGTGLDGWDWAFVEEVEKRCLRHKRPITDKAGRRLSRIWLTLCG